MDTILFTIKKEKYLEIDANKRHKCALTDVVKARYQKYFIFIFSPLVILVHNLRR
jgi:Na+/pantothenate symporter